MSLMKSVSNSSEHTQVDPLASPGQFDLTADVDFSHVIDQLQRHLCVFGPIGQGTFLKEMHLEVRVKQLLKNCKDDAEKRTLESAVRTLTHPDEMGEKFKVSQMFF